MDDRQARGDALRRYIKSQGLSQREAADKIGIKPPHLANLLSAKDSMGHIVVRKICEAFPEISAVYLLTGEGVLVPPPGTVHINQHQSVSGNGTGVQTITQSHALEMEVQQLREQLAQAKEREDRLLGIIDTLTQK